MQDRAPLSASHINDDLLRFVLTRPAPRWFWIAVTLLSCLVLAAVAVVGGLVLDGLQLLGLTGNVYWAIFIANFIFGVGMSHAGVMISAILRLTQAERR